MSGSGVGGDHDLGTVEYGREVWQVELAGKI
jgi:hypothetical protein